jgi:DNA-binding transcriptional MocR family regulator
MMKDTAGTQFSEYGLRSQKPSPVARMMSSFASDFREGYDINLGVGYVNEKTIPHKLIKEALVHVLSHPSRYRCALNYGGPQGSPNLIESIRRYYVSHHIGGITEEVLNQYTIIIGPSGATSLLDGIADIFKPGLVITSDPMYYIYCNILERKGFSVLTIPEDGEGIQTERLEQKIEQLGDKAADIRFFYIVTINNPTSTILSNRRRRELVDIATGLSHKLGRHVPIFFDKAYEDLIHDPAVEPVRSGLLFDTEGLVYELGTLSKILAPGIRVGYMIGRDGPLLRALIQKTNDVGFSAPMICQEMASYLLDNHIDRQIAAVNRGYRQKAIAVKQALDELLGKRITECRGGSAGFYYYLTLDGIETCEGSAFFTHLTRTTGNPDIDGPLGKRNPMVVYVPGEFCVHPKGDMREVGKYQLRISYGYEETERIIKAIGIMREAVEA